MKNPPKIIVAVDTTDIDEAKELLVSLSGTGILIKLGLEFAEAHGPQGIQELFSRNLAIKDTDLFLDHKWSDIPNTVAGACNGALAITHKRPDIVNVHATGGVKMMKKAVEAAFHSSPKTKVIAVTVLTSMTDNDVKDIFGAFAFPYYINNIIKQTKQVLMGMSGWSTVFRLPRSISAEVAIHLAYLASEAGCDGVVSSGWETSTIKHLFGDAFIVINPGIRLAGGNTHDQARVMTPEKAALAGADYLVIGRAITEAENPKQVVLDIQASLANL